MQLAWRQAEVAGHIKTKTSTAAGGGCDVTVSGTVEQTMRLYTATAKLFLQDICYENRAWPVVEKNSAGGQLSLVIAVFRGVTLF